MFSPRTHSYENIILGTVVTTLQKLHLMTNNYPSKPTECKKSLWLVIFMISLGLIAIVAYQTKLLPIDYDEAYNLQVADTLSKGGGYASYGALRGAKWLFDPYITTGPTVLLPMALIWFLSSENIWLAHIFMLSFFLAYLISLYGLFKFENDSKLPSIVAIAIALCLSITPGMVLGEVPGAAMIIFAAWAATKDRTFIVGIMIGLAIQTKLVYGFAGLAMALTCLITLIVARNNRLNKKIFLLIFLAILPTFLFELYRLYSFNGILSAYVNSLMEMRLFLQSQSIQSQVSWQNGVAISTKLKGLYTFLPLGGWISIGVLFTYSLWTTALSLWHHLRKQHDNINTETNNLNVVVVGLILSGCTVLAAWLFFSKQTSDRQAIPFLLLTLPALGGWGTYNYRKLRGLFSNRWLANFLKITLFLSTSLLALILSAKIIGTVRKFPLLAISQKEQYTVADLVKHSKTGSIFVEGWWQNPEFLLLSKIKGLPIRTPTQSQLLIVQDYQVISNNSIWDIYKQRCGKILYVSAKILVCWL